MLTNHLKTQQNVDLFWKVAIFSFLALIFIAMPGAGYAQTSICTVLNSILTSLTGAPARILATFAVCFLGVAAFFGKLQWGTAMLVMVGIGLIFGASTLLGTFITVASTC